MGGSISSTLSQDQLGVITEEIRLEYEEMLKENTLSEDEIKQKLMLKYENYVKETTATTVTLEETNTINTPPVITPKGTPSITPKDTPKAENKKGLRAVPKTKTAQAFPTSERRKSFDTKNVAIKKASQNANQVLQSTPENTETTSEPSKDVVTSTTKEDDVVVVHTMHHSQSEPVLTQVDSWCSVSDQPYCTICQMAFKSLAFLDRHVKYSDVHIKNVNKLASDANQSNEVVDKLQEKMIQKEGVHYKLLYHGAKLFWKTKDNFIIDIFHHIIPQTIEIVSFCDIRCKEISRIYLDFNILAKIVEKEVMEKCKDEIAKHKKEKTPTPLDDLLVDARRKAITSMILSHLQLNVAGEIRSVLFMKSGADNYSEDPTLKIPPDSLIPVSVARKRKTNMEDFNAAMKGLEADKAALKEAMSHAEKILSIVQNSVKQFASRNAIYARLNPIRKRWFLAVRRIISQNYVAQYTNLLEIMEKKKKEKDLPKRRARNSTIYSSKAQRPKEV